MRDFFSVAMRTAYPRKVDEGKERALLLNQKTLRLAICKPST
jgi:hypothetical protein